MKLQRVSSIQLPALNQNFKKINDHSDESPNESALTHDGSEYGVNIQPFDLGFTEKERVYVLVQWKLKKLLTSQSDEMNVIKSSTVQSALPREVILTQILPYAGTRQEVFYLLLCLTKRMQKYVVKNQEKLTPFFVEGQPLIERYLTGAKKCMQNYSQGIKTRKQLGELIYNTQPIKDETPVELRPRVTFGNQIEYEGERDMEGRRHGKGVEFNRFGFLYEGQWRDNKMHGYGRQIQPNGAYYVGKWKNSDRYGRGYQLFVNDTEYEGQWRENQIHGMGVMTYPDGTYYDGQWKKGYKHGQGVQSFDDGRLRRGEWELGELKQWLSKPYKA